MKKIFILLAAAVLTSACSAHYSGYYDDYDYRSGLYGSSYGGYYKNYNDRYRNYRDHDGNRNDRYRGDRDHRDRTRGDNRDRADRDRYRGHADENHQAKNSEGEYRR